MQKNKKIILTILIMLIIANLSLINVFAGGGVHIVKESYMPVWKAYESVDAYNNGEIPLFIKLNPTHADNKKVLDWAKAVGVGSLYDSWLPLRIVPLIENGILRKSAVYLWDVPLTDTALDSYIPTNNFENLNLLALYENNQTVLGTNGLNLVSSSNKNLKYPLSGDPGSSFVNFNSTGIVPELDASGIIPSGQRSSKKYDWRYIGFSEDGDFVPNSVFPVDATTDHSKDADRNYIKWEKVETVLKVDERPTYDKSLDIPEFKSFFNIFFELQPKFLQKSITEGYTSADAWKYWTQYLAWYSNPQKYSGVIKGWFYNVNNNIRYISFTTPFPEQDNMVMQSFDVIRISDGKLIDRVYKDASNVIVNTNKNATLEKGVSYKIVGSMTYEAGEHSKTLQTIYTPSKIDFYTDFDEKAIAKIASPFILDYGDINDIFDVSKLVYTNVTHPTSKTIKDKEVITFEQMVTLDNSALDSYYFSFKVPNGYFLTGDNMNRTDDFNIKGYNSTFL